MINYELTKVLVQDRQHELTHSAVVARLARRVRRSRRNGVQVGDVDNFTVAEVPAPATADPAHAHGHALAA